MKWYQYLLFPSDISTLKKEVEGFYMPGNRLALPLAASLSSARDVFGMKKQVVIAALHRPCVIIMQT